MVPLRHKLARRRHGRDPDQPVAAAEQGLARLRGLGQGAQQDPPRDPRSPRTRAPASSAATLLEREMRKAGLSLPRALERRRARRAGAACARAARADDLLAAIGYGARAARRRSCARCGRTGSPSRRPKRPERPARGPKQLLELFRRQPKASSTGIRVDGQGDVLVRFAQLLHAAARRRGGRLRDARPRRDRAPEGLPRRASTSIRSAASTWSGTPTPQVARAHPHARHLAGRARPAREDHQDDLRRGHQHRRGARHHPRRPHRRRRASTSGSRTCARSPSVMKEIERIKGILSVERVRG